MRQLLAPAVLTIAVALTACGPGTPVADESETPKPTVTAEAPTPTPTPDPDPEPAPVTCESIVTPATISGFASQGIGITPPAAFHDKLVNEGNDLALFFDAGGVVCQTGKGQGAYEIYAYGVLDSAQVATLGGSFVSEGYDEIVGDVGLQYTVPGDMEGLPRTCYLRPGAFSVCGNDDDRIAEIIGVLGLG